MAVNLLGGSLIGALAQSARAPVHCLVGDGGRQRARSLWLDDRVRFVPSPRHAAVLLVVGHLPPDLHNAARRVHDQLPEPRGAVVWEDAGAELPFPRAVRARDRDGALRAVVELHRGLVTGRRESAPTLGPRDNPVRWRGVGPHGQGGEGMMGGVPYGRPMAKTGEDVRDGLDLDRLAVTVGPFLPWLPPGLCLSLELQGDVIQSLSAGVVALGHRDVPEVFARARTDPVRIADLEVARARHHLAATADLLFLLGLEGVARHVLHLAAEATPDEAGRVRRLERTLRRRRMLRLATRGVGVLPADRLGGAGPVARAAGRREDARQEDPAYRGLGFGPVVSAAGDAEARWQQRLAEAAQALELAARAGDRQRAPDAPLEAPRGSLEWAPRPPWLTLLSDTAPGQAWDAFVTTLASLDLDPAGLAATRDAATEGPCPT